VELIIIYFVMIVCFGGLGVLCVWFLLMFGVSVFGDTLERRKKINEVRKGWKE
jgi:hypothetical protein